MQQTMFHQVKLRAIGSRTPSWVLDRVAGNGKKTVSNSQTDAKRSSQDAGRFPMNKLLPSECECLPMSGGLHCATVFQAWNSPFVPVSVPVLRSSDRNNGPWR